MAPPAAPVLVGPGSSAKPGPTVSGTAQTFRWNKVVSATNYLLDVKDLTAGTATTTYAISGGSTTSYAIGLIAGHSYQWNMYAFDGASESVSSKMRYFTIHASPLPTPVHVGTGPVRR